MKNVTGYDLCKLMTGSWGTLGVMSQVTVKVLPVAEKAWTVLLYTDDAEAAVAALSAGLNSPYDVSGAAWIPASLTERIDVDHVRDAGDGVVALRLEGPGPSVEYRCGALRQLFDGRGPTEELHSMRSRAFWQAVRDVKPFASPEDSRVVWKLSVAPTDGPAVLRELQGLRGADVFADWGGGLIWLAVDMPKLGGAELVRDAVAKVGGHATLIRGDAELRKAVSVFQPLTPGIRKITEKIKDGFDPHRILNPGRMYEGL